MRQPPDTSLIQIGFNESLNYDFVAQHQVTIWQMFNFTPLGLGYGLDCNPYENVTMHSLQAFDTRAQWGYVTTLALAYIPTPQVGTLALEVRTAVSKLYSNPNSTINGLMAMINPSIPILAGNVPNGGPGSYGNGAVGPGGSSNMGSSSGGPIRGTSVGLAVGVVCGAGVYGAAMFYVARRYKKRKQGHARSPSMNSGDEGSPGYDAMMSGANRAGSASGSASSRPSPNARQAGISHPIMAENSLGWR